MSIKNPPTPAGIEPATFRFVAQHLNHCATAVTRFNLCFCYIVVLTEIYINKVSEMLFTYGVL